MKLLLPNVNIRLFWLCWLAVALSLPVAARRRTVLPAPPANTRCDYHLRWDGRSTRLRVQLDYAAAGPDSTVFLFDANSLGGQADIFSILEGITAGPADRLRLVAAQHKIVVCHRQAGRHSLRYALNGAISGPRQCWASPMLRLYQPPTTGKQAGPHKPFQRLISLATLGAPEVLAKNRKHRTPKFGK